MPPAPVATGAPGTERQDDRLSADEGEKRVTVTFAIPEDGINGQANPFGGRDGALDLSQAR